LSLAHFDLTDTATILIDSVFLIALRFRISLFLDEAIDELQQLDSQRRDAGGTHLLPHRLKPIADFSFPLAQPPAADGPGDRHDVDPAVVEVGLARGGPLDERRSPPLGVGDQWPERVGEAARDGEVGRATDAVVVDEAEGGAGAVED
jgi:hypothetical protein